jgi:type I restriction enzyme S subunit
LSGEKRLEFRRRWTATPVDLLLIYSSSPTKRLVATANVVEVTKGTPTALWELSKAKGGGVTRKLIYDYFTGTTSGFAIEIADVNKFRNPIDPKKVLGNFSAPQSFRYIDTEDYRKIVGALCKE